MKKVFITNGSGGKGKDTFVRMCRDYLLTKNTMYNQWRVEKISSIDCVKTIAHEMQCDVTAKTEKDRKFLSDMKMLWSEYNDGPYQTISQYIEQFLQNPDFKDGIIFVDIREPEEINRAVNDFNGESI